MNFFDENLLSIGDKKYTFHNVKSFKDIDTSVDILNLNKGHTVKVCEEKPDNCTELSSINYWTEKEYSVIIGSETKERAVPNNITKKRWEWYYEDLIEYYN